MNIQSFRPMNNYVVLKPEIDTSKFTYGSVEFFMPLSSADGKPYDKHKSQPIVCSVVATPRKLIFGKRKVFWETVEELDLPPEQKMYLHKIRREAKFTETTLVEVPIPGSMRWKTRMNVKQGDIVWVNSSALIGAEERKFTVECDKQLYYMVQYEDLYLKKDGDNVSMLNGWLLCDVIQDIDAWMKQAERIGLFIPDIMKDRQFNDRLAVVKYIGEPVEYLFNDTYDHPEIKEGDVVLLKWKTNRKLEKGAKYFAKDSDLSVSRRANIIGIME